MKNIQHHLFVLFFLSLAYPHCGFSQDKTAESLSFEVNRIYPPFAMTMEKLHAAQTLSDLFKTYRPEWVKEYVAVEVLTTYQGKEKRTVGKSDTLSAAQKESIRRADAGTEISISVHYFPENTLSHNDMKEVGYSFQVAPANEAKYPGGQQAMRKYLQESAISKIPAGSFGPSQLSAVIFTVDEAGHIVDAHLYWPSEHEKIDEILLQAICNMPSWEPATYGNGQKIKQEFAFMVGDMESCVVNLLNVRPF